MRSFLLSAVFLLSVCCVFSTKVDFHHGDTPHKDCSNHHAHFSHDKIEKMNRGEPMETTDKESGQHVLCILKERKIVSEDGIVNKDVLKTRLAKFFGEGNEDVQKGVDCLVQKSDQIDTAIAFYNCVAPYVKKHNA
ncbi:uncharacterized protein LOC123674803 [Harmonia axyridis]|uniref:uncharacterized protein LOC123674803 n=1 Tax=Harmonia axyridis TaxID=115357 RepID=UPI001E278EE4|nr:uncharacterized protein LOC123674803 [Harmonia axyridis]